MLIRWYNAASWLESVTNGDEDGVSSGWWLVDCRKWMRFCLIVTRESSTSSPDTGCTPCEVWLLLHCYIYSPTRSFIHSFIYSFT